MAIIVIDFDEYCQDCLGLKPVVKREYQTWGPVYRQTITCANIQQCRRVADYVKEQKENGNA